MATALRCQQLLGVSVFQVKEARVSWGYGAIRGDRDLSSGLRVDLGMPSLGQCGVTLSDQTIVLVKGRRAMLQWVCLRDHRALFVLRRERVGRLLEGNWVGHVRAVE